MKISWKRAGEIQRLVDSGLVVTRREGRDIVVALSLRGIIKGVTLENIKKQLDKN